MTTYQLVVRRPAFEKTEIGPGQSIQFTETYGPSIGLTNVTHAGDVILVDVRAHEVRVRGETTEFVKQSHERCLGIRALVAADGGASSATTSTSDLADEAVDAMVDEFHETAGEFEEQIRAQELSLHELVTLASIVEKETGAPHERPLIAAVFLNRLERGMRLETDPTVIYGVENFDGNLRKVHLLDATNLYNTYKIAGLPPGPIANAGREALAAVLNPADSPFLFFVSQNNGTHVFSKTYAEHERAVDRYQRRRRR